MTQSSLWKTEMDLWNVLTISFSNDKHNYSIELKDKKNIDKIHDITILRYRHKNIAPT